MLLVFDIGNSNIVMGTYEGKKLLRHWRISTDRQKTGDEYGMLINSLFAYQNIRMEQVEAIIISSVVPPLMVPMIKMCERYFHIHPLVVGPGIKTGFRISYENPREIGADRIVNVAPNGDFQGGVIAPGLSSSADALFQRAAKLPRIELVTPKHIISRNTVSGMQAGIIYGYVGQIDEIVRRMKKEMGYDEIRVIATGGYARMISRESKTIDKIDHFLTLTGLRVLYERNCP